MKTGQYIPPPVVCEKLEHMVARCGGSMVFRLDEASVDYALPAHASAEVLDYFRRHATAGFERAYVARLPGGRVFGSGNVLSPDGKSIARDVSPDFGKSFEEHWLLSYKNSTAPATAWQNGGGRDHPWGWLQPLVA